MNDPFSTTMTGRDLDVRSGTAYELPGVGSVSGWRARLESVDELLLCCRFDRGVAVGVSYPGDSGVGLLTCEDGRARECGAGAAVAAQAANFGQFTVGDMVQQFGKCFVQLARIVGDSEVWPRKVIVRPGGLPMWVEVETVIWPVGASVGVGCIE